MLVTMTGKDFYSPGIIQRVFDRALLQRDAENSCFMTDIFAGSNDRNTLQRLVFAL